MLSAQFNVVRQCNVIRQYIVIGQYNVIRALITIGIIALVAFLFLPPGIGTIDLLQYWSSAKLLSAGLNPYDPVLTEALQHLVRSDNIPILMWNPPTIFALILLVAFLPFWLLIPLWFAISLCCVLWSVVRTPLLFAKKSHLKWIWWMSCFTFLPVFSNLSYGQVSHVLLITWVLFLGFYSKGGRREDCLAGLAASFFSLKPHLFIVPGLWIAWEMCRARRDQFWVGLGLGLLLLGAVPLLFSPNIFAWYMDAISSPPLNWKTPTLGSWLQGISGDIKVRAWPLYVAITGTLVWLVLKRPSQITADNLAVIMGLSIIFSPYGWIYDQILLLPLLFLAAANGGTWLGVATIIINLAAMSGIVGDAQSDYTWYPPTLTVLALLSVRRTNHNH